MYQTKKKILCSSDSGLAKTRNYRTLHLLQNRLLKSPAGRAPENVYMKYFYKEIIFNLSVNSSIFFVIKLVLHATCDDKDIAQYLFFKFKMAATAFALCQTFKYMLVDLHLKTGLNCLLFHFLAAIVNEVS